MKKFIGIILALFLISSTTFATGEKEIENKTNTNTSVSVSGSVEDLLTSEKLVCAKIEIEELDKTIFTDILGNYEIPELKPGKYTFKVSYIAYEEAEISQVVVSDSKDINIQLKPL
jgi:hypothetical protein